MRFEFVCIPISTLSHLGIAKICWARRTPPPKSEGAHTPLMKYATSHAVVFFSRWVNGPMVITAGDGQHRHQRFKSRRSFIVTSFIFFLNTYIYFHSELKEPITKAGSDTCNSKYMYSASSAVVQNSPWLKLTMFNANLCVDHCLRQQTMSVRTQ